MTQFLPQSARPRAFCILEKWGFSTLPSHNAHHHIKGSEMFCH